MGQPPSALSDSNSNDSSIRQRSKNKSLSPTKSDTGDSEVSITSMVTSNNGKEEHQATDNISIESAPNTKSKLQTNLLMNQNGQVSIVSDAHKTVLSNLSSEAKGPGEPEKPSEKSDSKNAKEKKKDLSQMRPIIRENWRAVSNSELAEIIKRKEEEIMRKEEETRRKEEEFQRKQKNSLKIMNLNNILN